MKRIEDVKTRLILASASPRRRELLGCFAIPFDVAASEIPEIVRPGEDPEPFAVRLAREKAEAVARRFEERWVLGADTIVVLEGDPARILGKPETIEQAVTMLAELSGRAHWVMTGMALVRFGPQGDRTQSIVWIEKSRVIFRELALSEIEEYVKSGEPMDKAGAYAIQGGARKFVDRYEGSYSNIVGLPLESLEPRLEEIGLIDRWGG